jgi:hypothetical protein
MIVLDASVVVELLTNGSLADETKSDLAGRDEPFTVPHLVDVEVVSAIRRLAAGRPIDAHRSCTGSRSAPVHGRIRASRQPAPSPFQSPKEESPNPR